MFILFKSNDFFCPQYIFPEFFNFSQSLIRCYIYFVSNSQCICGAIYEFFSIRDYDSL